MHLVHLDHDCYDLYLTIGNIRNSPPPKKNAIGESDIFVTIMLSTPSTHCTFIDRTEIGFSLLFKCECTTNAGIKHLLVVTEHVLDFYLLLLKDIGVTKLDSVLENLIGKRFNLLII